MKRLKDQVKTTGKESDLSYIEEEIRHATAMRNFHNSQKGYQNNCEHCKGRGMFEDFKVKHQDVYTYVYACPVCENRIDKETRIEESNSASELDRMTFSTWVANDTESQKIFTTAKKFVRQDETPFFYIGGNVGSGKTHICLAMTEELSTNKNFNVLWWKKDIGNLKKQYFDFQEKDALYKYNNVELLYIDDMLATTEQNDFKIIMEIIEHRYNKRLTTIISSEHSITNLVEFNEALATRIIEISKGFNITSKMKNRRI